MKILIALLSLITIKSFAQMPPMPEPVQRCLQTNIVSIDTSSTVGGLSNHHIARVVIEPKNCPQTWYYGIVNGERRQWCIHAHDATKFESGQFEAGITHLWRTEHHIPDLMVIKVKEESPQQWTIPAQTSK